MNRSKLSFGFVAIVLGAVSGAWLIQGKSEPSPPSSPAGSEPQSHGSQAPLPQRAFVGSGRDTAVRPEEEEEEREETSERPRAAGEWQGMKVDEAETWPCGDGCSMARACSAGKCVPCLADDQCETGEVCVLDHCVLEKLTECRRAADCGDPEALCVLTGYTSGDLRGNRDMRAHCSYPERGQPDDAVSAADAPVAPGEDDGAVAAAVAADRPPSGSSVLDELRQRAGRP